QSGPPPLTCVSSSLLSCVSMVISFQEVLCPARRRSSEAVSDSRSCFAASVPADRRPKTGGPRGFGA
ncbi:MAG TPA: hypothetical protein VN903_32555, partial [Polyangia bacterium]|nr:hypothetical protein [Polyangia bacterium]